MPTVHEGMIVTSCKLQHLQCEHLTKIWSSATCHAQNVAVAHIIKHSVHVFDDVRNPDASATKLALYNADINNGI